MEKSNDHCGVGVAHRANLGGLLLALLDNIEYV